MRTIFITTILILVVSFLSYSQLTLADIEKTTKVPVDEYVEYLQYSLK